MRNHHTRFRIDAIAQTLTPGIGRRRAFAVAGSGLAKCDKRCYGLQFDKNHYGSCDIACDADERCIFGECGPAL